MLEWVTEADETLAGEGVKEAADLAWMLGVWRAGHVRAFEVKEPGHVAWCRVDKAGLRCIAVAPDDGRREVNEVTFFAEPFPDDWKTKRRVSRRAVAWPSDGYVFGVLAGGRVVLARAAAGRMVQPSPDAPWMRCEDHTAKTWHVLTGRLGGAANLFVLGRVAFSNYLAFRLALWRADDPAAAKAARLKAGKAAKAARAARKRNRAVSQQSHS